jgi:hypothetical protein
VKLTKLCKVISGNSGIALLVAISMLLLTMVIGIASLNYSNVGWQIESNFKTSKQAFNYAEAGLEFARETLREKLVGPPSTTLTAQLLAAAGGDKKLIDSTSLANFPPAGSTDDVPFIPTTSFPPPGNVGRFIVYLTNDPVEGVTSTTDANNLVTLTSFGYGPNHSRAVVQAVVSAASFPTLPASVNLPGPNVVFGAPNSNATSMAGDATYPAIAVTTSTSVTTVINSIKSQRYGNYTGASLTPSVKNMGPLPTPWNDVSGIQSIYASALNKADFTSPSQAGFTLGTTSNRKTVVINGDYSLNGSGAGVLVVTGQLTLHGGFSYEGLILVIGKGYVQRDGGGNGNIDGGIFVANISGPDGIINTPDDVMANPTMDTNGGGNSVITYDPNSQAQSLGNFAFSVSRTVWKILGQ